MIGVTNPIAAVDWPWRSHVVVPAIKRVDPAPLPTDPATPGVAVTGTGFATQWQGDCHIGTRVQISRTPDFSEVLRDVLVPHRGSVYVDGLEPGAAYYARLAHEGRSLGWSHWSPPFPFVFPAP